MNINDWKRRIEDELPQNTMSAEDRANAVQSVINMMNQGILIEAINSLPPEKADEFESMTNALDITVPANQEKVWRFLGQHAHRYEEIIETEYQKVKHFLHSNTQNASRRKQRIAQSQSISDTVEESVGEVAEMASGVLDDIGVNGQPVSLVELAANVAIDPVAPLRTSSEKEERVNRIVSKWLFSTVAVICMTWLIDAILFMGSRELLSMSLINSIPDIISTLLPEWFKHKSLSQEIVITLCLAVLLFVVLSILGITLNFLKDRGSFGFLCRIIPKRALSKDLMVSNMVRNHALFNNFAPSDVQSKHKMKMEISSIVYKDMLLEWGKDKFCTKEVMEILEILLDDLEGREEDIVCFLQTRVTDYRMASEQTVNKFILETNALIGSIKY